VDFSNPVVIGWAGVSATFLVWVLGRIFGPRRKLSVWFSGSSFLAAPDDDLGLAVTFQGEPIPEPVHVVRMQLQCGGNRDVAIEAADDFVSVSPVEGIDLITARYRRTGETKLTVLESTSRIQKFKFDLLKRSDRILVDLYVRTRKPIDPDSLPRHFKTAVHIRDVGKVMLAPRRFELWGAALAAIGIAGVYAFAAVGPMFSPVGRDRLLLNSASELVVANDARGAEVEICRTTPDLWAAAACEWKQVAEVGMYRAAPPDAPTRYMNVLSMWERFGLIGILAVAVGMFAFGSEIPRAIMRLWRNIRRRE
jgi:hypothetical protein